MGMPVCRTDDQSLPAMYRRTLPEVYGYLLHRCGDRSLAEDLCSETYLAAVDRIREGGAGAVTVSWLKAVAHNKLVDHWRRVERARQRQGRLELVPPGPTNSDDAIVDRAVVLEALGRLPLDQRLALTLHYLDGLDVAAIGARLGRSRAAVESLLARGRRALARRLQEAR